MPGTALGAGLIYRRDNSEALAIHITPILRMRTPRQRKAKEPAQPHTAGKWRSWGTDPGTASKAFLSTAVPT